MATRCVPGPIESCSFVWRTTGEGVQARLQGHLRTLPLGAIEEVCADQVGDPQGVAVKVWNGRIVDELAGPGQDSGLRVTSDGELWVRRPPKKQRTLSAQVNAAVNSGDTTLLETTFPIDTTQFDENTCWEVCVDVCDAFVTAPYAGPPTVTIPEATVLFAEDTHEMPLDIHEMPVATHSVPNVFIEFGENGGNANHDHGGDFSHDHGGNHNHDHGGNHTHDHGGDQVHDHGGELSVVERPAPASMFVTINGKACRIFSADRFANNYSGRLCVDVLVAPNQTYEMPIRVHVLAFPEVEQAFTAGSGELVVNVEMIECAEQC